MESRVTHQRGSAVLALGFGTTLAMWTIGYVCRFPGVEAPGWLLMALLLFCLTAGGWAAGRFTDRGLIGGLQAGLLAGVLNLLILGSLLTRADGSSGLIPTAAVWVPGSLLLAGALGVLGALAGRPRTRTPVPDLAAGGLPGFALVACGTTFLLLVAGGIVTGSQAGLAVVDWPNSYGYNMFLYPLSRMTGGIYYEHVHRLLGSLVGLTTVVLAITVARIDDRRWLKILGLGAVALVIGQGVLGGLRVTGTFTMSDDPAVTRPSLALAVVHGVVGQIFFAVMVAIATVTTRRWRATTPNASPAGGVDRKLSAWLLGTIVVQLTLGALLRHVDAALHAHITAAVVALGLGIALGSRLALRRRDHPVLRRVGHALLHGLTLQFLLGFGALFVRNLTATDGGPHTADVVITTIHQALGALLLALAVLATLWTRRAGHHPTGDHDARPGTAGSES